MLPEKDNHVTIKWDEEQEVTYHSSEEISFSDREDAVKLTHAKTIDLVKYYYEAGLCDKQGVINILASAGVNNLEIVKLLNENRMAL